MNEKRRRQIVQMLQTQQALTNQELMDRFGVSIETVRRDLTYLERKGALTKVYGGAVKKEVATTEPLYESRERKNNEEKQCIAQSVQDLIATDDIVFFDLGTTVEAAAGKLDKGKNIHAFTNALRTAAILSEKCPDVIVTGGKVRTGELSLSGTLAQTNLANFNIGKALIGVGGITQEGISDFIADEAGLRREVIRSALQVIVLADHTKFGVRAMCNVCSLDKVDIVITDTKAPKDIIQQLEKAGVKVIIAK